MAADDLATRALAALGEAEGALVCIVGPTASGKTELAIRLAERLGGEIISADSVQIYRHFDVGSGKPSAADLARVPHHMISILDPLEPTSAADYATMADRAVRDVRARGKKPIVCGGTYFWVRSLVLGLASAPPANAEVRARHRAVVAREGRIALHAELAQKDPASADRLHPNDVVRVSRALEILELSGRAMSEIHAEHGFRSPRHRAHLLGVHLPSDVLAARIEARAAGWLEHGWIEEVEALLARGYGDARAMASVGYAEVRAMLEGALPRERLAEAIAQSTRSFARKQRTWLRSAPVTWLEGA